MRAPTEKQPLLFPDLVFEENTVAKTASKLVTELCGVRRQIPRELHDDPEFKIIVESLTQTIENIRAYSRLSPTQKQELVLYAVEKHQCWTVPDIAAQTKFTEKEVRQIADELVNLKLARYVRRFIPGGCFKKYYFIKSNRVHVPDAD